MFLFCVGIAKDLDGQKWEELYHQILLFNAAYDTLVASRGFIFFQLTHCCFSIEKKSFSCRTMTTRWWQLQIFFMFTPNYLGVDDPILTINIFQTWVGWKTTKQKTKMAVRKKSYLMTWTSPPFSHDPSPRTSLRYEVPTNILQNK